MFINIIGKQTNKCFYSTICLTLRSNNLYNLKNSVFYNNSCLRLCDKNHHYHHQFKRNFISNNNNNGTSRIIKNTLENNIVILRGKKFLNQLKNGNLFFKRLNQTKSNATTTTAGKSAKLSGEVVNTTITETVGKPSTIKFKTSDIRRLFSLAKSEKWVLLAGVTCLIISSTITMSVPYALGKILDIIFNGSSEAKEMLTNFCVILGGIFIIGGLANFGRVYLFSSASLRIVKDIRTKLYRTMMNQEAGWFDQKGTGELINRLSADSYFVGNSLTQNVSDGLRSTVTILVGTGMMIYTSPQLALVSLCIVPGIAGIAVIYGRFVRNITRRLLDQYAQIMKTGEERLNNIKTVKIFCKENQESTLFLNQLLDALNLGYKEVLARASFYGMTGLSGNIIIISVLYYGGLLVTNQELSVGALTSFILYAGYTALSIGGLSDFYTELNKGLGSASRIWEIWDREFAIPVEGGLLLPNKPDGQIIFKDVMFSFPSRPNNPILNKLNLIIPPHQITAVVGRSGSGKSTLATLLLRLYDPTTGDIYLDNKNLKELNPSWLRSHIGAVNQEPILFSGTIRENILYGLNPGDRISEKDFEKIIYQAHVTEFTRALPKGLETLVGQRGMMLSGGQKQRVAIARALIRNPSILILDEATSALDAVSEALVQNALENLTQGRTVLTIAHRLSTIRNAQNIIVMDNGNIVEQGCYDDLIGKDNGTFKNLVEKQTFQTTVILDEMKTTKPMDGVII